MAKPLPIQIHIPKPCNEDWDKMTPNTDGRFCTHCQKTVIDFTQWNDADLYQYMMQNQQVCGRFLNSQTYRTLQIPVQPHSKLYRMFMSFGLTLLFVQAADIEAKAYSPLIEQTLSGSEQQQTDSTKTAKHVDNIPTRSANEIVSTTVGGALPRVYDSTKGTAIGGGRPLESHYIIDGWAIDSSGKKLFKVKPRKKWRLF